MKFTLIALLATAASVTAQLPAPEVAVYYVNENAGENACTEAEFSYIDSKMIPDLDMALISNNFDPAEWEFSTTDPARRKLNGTCDWCRQNYSRSYCNTMFNCGFRRQLRQNDDSRKLDTTQLGAEMLQMCQDNIVLISTRNRFLTAGCKTALAGSTCHVQFI
ncbi:hypothetical protein FisN_10Lu385 [Fistulifera solaris]|jgi:hypothetical protein|uniref:Uncharacterized protein n=1 Tax=Fistulifera solaris TaxID=1519565 RepID=A0A1Z5JV66_FISSO|nr:hypothetical protein FisN_10Lu385 [Fistulifera solaris]|eukprot:GAX17668.1 hypothetical protein FisN_10Lu385 [Fistulifera solaris]